MRSSDSLPSPSRLRWHRVRWWVPVAALLLALHAWLALSAVEHIGPTADEPLHLVSGYTYWRLNDYRLPPASAKPPQRGAGGTMMFDHTPPRLPVLTHNPEWTQSQCPMFCDTFDYYSGNPIYFYLFRARAAMLVFSIGLGILIFSYSKHLWGPAGGCYSLALYCLSPCFLANAPLVTSDLCATFFLIAATAAYWWSLQNRSWQRTLPSGLVLGLACVAKFSAFLLGPVYLILMVITLLLGRGGEGSATRRSLRLCALGLGQILIAWAVVWTFLGWRYGAANPDLPAMEKFVTPWDFTCAGINPHLVAGINFLRDHHLFPENYLYGFCNVIHFSSQRGAFLNGVNSSTGWWYFFPFAFAMKTAIASLCAFIASLVIGIRVALARRKQTSAFSPWLKTWSLRIAPLVVFFIVYWAAALTSHLNIGQRHILPIYPALFIMAGLLLHRRAQSAARIFACLLLVGLTVESFAVRPHYLAFFNQLSGGPSEGYQHLVDSSLDWGQDLPLLVSWLHTHQNPSESVYLSYLGTDSPAYEGLSEAKIICPLIDYHRPFVFSPLTQGLYCIGATMLQQTYNQPGVLWSQRDEIDYRNLLDAVKSAQNNHQPIPLRALSVFDRSRFSRLCLYLRLRQPTAIVGYTIFIYRLTDQEVKVATEGSMDDILQLAGQK